MTCEGMDALASTLPFVDTKVLTRASSSFSYDSVKVKGCPQSEPLSRSGVVPWLGDVDVEKLERKHILIT